MRIYLECGKCGSELKSWASLEDDRLRLEVEPCECKGEGKKEEGEDDDNN